MPALKFPFSSIRLILFMGGKCSLGVCLKGVSLSTNICFMKMFDLIGKYG